MPASNSFRQTIALSTLSCWLLTFLHSIDLLSHVLLVLLLSLQVSGA
jgi:hypothetical protein